MSILTRLFGRHPKPPKRFRFNLIRPAMTPSMVERDTLEIEAPNARAAHAIALTKARPGWVIGPAQEIDNG